ncbi:MAG: DUF192 domain-containing protein [Candidatus Levybacteria bacterium]|nr:DUF192 domain-containing protein [Candidatus Levybacteria bacterium]
MLKNITLGVSTDLKVIQLKSLWDKTFGAIRFKDKILSFKTRFGIHSFFLKAPLDVVILDKEKRVVKIKENLLPNRLFFWNPKHSQVLELPSGFIEKLRLKVGHIVEFTL